MHIDNVSRRPPSGPTPGVEEVRLKAGNGSSDSKDNFFTGVDSFSNASLLHLSRKYNT